MNVNLVINDIRVPLRLEESGYVRIGKTKIRLDQVVHAYKDGYSVEGILDAWDVLDESDICTVIGYYLRNRQAVDTYCEQIEREEDEVQQAWERSLSPEHRAFLERLRSNRERRESERIDLQVAA